MCVGVGEHVCLCVCVCVCVYVCVHVYVCMYASIDNYEGRSVTTYIAPPPPPLFLPLPSSLAQMCL